MYVCLCKGITDSQIRQAVDEGATDLRQVRQQLGVASQCGKCSCLAREILKSAIQERSAENSALFYQLA
jgi:bacterioferritin-associated ferredoxin